MKRGNKKKVPGLKINKEKILIVMGIICLLLLLMFLYSKILFPSKNWYQDLDGDSFGNKAVNQKARFQPNGYVIDNTDLDDNNYCVPFAKDTCNTSNKISKSNPLIKDDTTTNAQPPIKSNQPVTSTPATRKSITPISTAITTPTNTTVVLPVPNISLLHCFH